MRIYLIGYSYSGKTTIGKKLAKLLDYNFFDTDKAIEIKYHTTIPLLFKRYGEKAFRIIESQILHTTGEMKDTVISTGGGTPCNDENIRFILDHGTAIHLQMSVDDIMQRISHSRKGRPSLDGMNTDEQLTFITKQLEQRLPYYCQARIEIPALNLDAEKIVEVLSQLRSENIG